MSTTIIGRCSCCGGRVAVPAIWHGINPPLATCLDCGAQRGLTPMPVIPMEPAPHQPTAPSPYIAPRHDSLEWWYGQPKVVSWT